MNWRRGLLLAGIHLVIAGSLIVLTERRDAKFIPEHRQTVGAKPIDPDFAQNGEAVAFDLCGATFNYSPQVRVVRNVNLPVVVLTGWSSVCPAPWTFAGLLHIEVLPQSMDSERRIDLVLCLVIPIQWFLLGGFPLIKPRRWWLEPGAIITICALAAFLLFLIPGLRDWSVLPGLFACLAWLYWFALLIWKGLRGGRRCGEGRCVLPKPLLVNKNVGGSV